MNRSYARHNHAGWVQRRISYPMSDLGREVAHVLGVVGGGIYNAPINIDKINWDGDPPWPIEVHWRGYLSSWDKADLSILLIECSRRLLRVEINPSNPHGLQLRFHKRKSRTGDMFERLPELTDIIETVEGWYHE